MPETGNKVKFKHALGAEVISNLNNFKGKITGRAQHIYGCNRYLVQPPVDKEGKVNDSYWFDEEEVVVVEKPTIKKSAKSTGGPSNQFK